MEDVFLEYFPEFNNSGLKYELDMPEVENSRQLPNPTVKVKISPMMTIKFHPLSIDEIVGGKATNR